MFISAFLLLMLAIGVCLLAIQRAFRLLGLEPMQTLLWLGLAEVPAPRSRRRPSIC